MKTIKLALLGASLSAVALLAAPAEARAHKVKVCKIVREHHHSVKRCHWVWRR